ncbi:Leishmanolysin-like peptidase [Lamellibrachia satsuma]|nr:Leishmanolysin-like peptidase [Lamellibrachia satsuma]
MSVFFCRPVAGYINICPKVLSDSTDLLIVTVKHELMHGLGFTSDFYDSSRFGGSSSFVTLPWMLKTVTRTYWKVASGTTTRQLKMITSPRVVEEVRKHFNCSTLEGAELEDQGSSGTADSHWEKRVFWNEAMTGILRAVDRASFSRITLAFLEDTGWYKVNFNMADSYQWGRNKGCYFVKKSCFDWMETADNRAGEQWPYCNYGFGRICARNHDVLLSCQIRKYKTYLPSKYQNFHTIYGVNKKNVPQYGGYLYLADYCPYAKVDSVCAAESHQPSDPVNFHLERYGQWSMCFKHGGQWKIRTPASIRHLATPNSGCYRVLCYNQSDGYDIVVERDSYRCKSPGVIHQVSITKDGHVFDGSITCLSYKEACTIPGRSVAEKPGRYPWPKDSNIAGEFSSTSTFLVMTVGIDTSISSSGSLRDPAPNTRQLMTMSVSTATAEWTFSVVRRLKNCLHFTMTTS